MNGCRRMGKAVRGTLGTVSRCYGQTDIAAVVRQTMYVSGAGMGVVFRKIFAEARFLLCKAPLSCPDQSTKEYRESPES